ncbi:MAG: rod shape-determining protein MreC [Armatimonadetes bacterium]|nr:rod shape-determining protein MreC [Armatimonadota bacterium]
MLAAAMGLGTLQNRMRGAGRLDPVSTTVQALLIRPVASLSQSMGNIDRFFAGVFSAERIKAENTRLRQLARAAADYQETVQRKDREISDLRAKLHLNTIGRERVDADIIHYVPYDNRITLDKGSRDGVKPNLPVITQDGLLALVSTVQDDTCQAVLITSSTVSIGCLAIGSPNVAGLVKGQRSDRLVMDVFDDVEITPGADVVTTGYSEFIPRGIRIGTVSEYVNDREFGVRRAFIVPSSQIGFSKEVTILK